MAPIAGMKQMKDAKIFIFSILHVTKTGAETWIEVAYKRSDALKQAIARAEKNGVYIEKIIVKKMYEI